MIWGNLTDVEQSLWVTVTEPEIWQGGEQGAFGRIPFDKPIQITHSGAELRYLPRLGFYANPDTRILEYKS